MDRKRATRDAANARVRVAQAQYCGHSDRNARSIRRARRRSCAHATGRNRPDRRARQRCLFRMARGGEMELMRKWPKTCSGSCWHCCDDQPGRHQAADLGPGVAGFAGHQPETRQGMVRIAVPYSAALRPGGFADARLVSGTKTCDAARKRGPERPRRQLCSDRRWQERDPAPAVKSAQSTDDGVSIASA